MEAEVHDKVVDILEHASSPDHAVDEALRHVVQAHTKGKKPIAPPVSNPAKPSQPTAAAAPEEMKEPAAAGDGKKVKKEPEKKPALNEALANALAAKGGAKVCKNCAKKSD